MKVIAFIAAVLLPTLPQAAETEFEFNGQVYSVDVKNKYCAPPKGSEYERRFHHMARNAVLNAVPVNVLHLMSCDGVKTTNGGNRVFSSIWIKPFLQSTPRMSDAELQSIVDANIKKGVTGALSDEFNSDQFKAYQQAISKDTGVIVKGERMVYEVQADPVVVLLILTKSGFETEEFVNMTFSTTRVINNRIFHFYLGDNYEYQSEIDHVKFLTDVALSFKVKN